MADIKFSQFTNGGDAQVGDEVVGLRAGLNARFTFPGLGIKDANGNYLFQYGTAGLSAVNFLAFTNSVSAASPKLSVEGADAVIGIDIITKGGGTVSIPAPVQDITTLEAGNIQISGNAISPTNTNGSVNINSIGSGNISLNSLKWMVGAGTAGQAVITDGVDQLSYASVPAVVGPATINAIARFVNIAGNLQDSLVLIDNFGNLSGVLSTIYNGATSGTTTLHAPAVAGITDITLPSTTGTLALTSDLPSLPLSLSNGGTGASLVASDGGIFYSNATTGAILSGTGTANQMLQSGSSSAPAWSSTTWPSTSTINRILFSTANNVIGEIAASNGGVLISNATGVPSMLANPGATGRVLQSVTANSAAWSGMAYPTTAGANETLLTSNGTDIVYTTAKYPTAAGTAGTILRSDGTNISNTLATYPNTTTVNEILFSSATNTIAGIASAANGVLITSAGSVPSISATLPSAVQSNITTVGTVTSGTWNAGVIAGQYGGTGVANTGRTITLGGNLTTTGAFNTTLAVSGTNTYTIPNVAAANVCLNLGGGVNNGTPKFFAFRNAVQSITNGVTTKVQLNNILFDTNGYFDATTNFRYTPLIAGYYTITANCGFVFPAASTNAVVTIHIYKNGAPYTTVIAGAISVAAQTVSNTNTCIVEMNGTTDFLEMFVLQTSAAARNTTSTQQTCYLTGSLIV